MSDAQQTVGDDVGRHTWLGERDHILLRPDMFLGANVAQEHVGTGFTRVDDAWRHRAETTHVAPIAFQMLSEVLSNAVDHAVKAVSVEIDAATATLTVTNDTSPGAVPVAPWPGALPEGVTDRPFTPEVLFFNMRSSSNFNDTTTRCTIGRNGVGIAAAFVFCAHASVHVNDPVNTKSFEQTYRDNMKTRGEARVVTSRRQKPDVRVALGFDLARIAGFEGRDTLPDEFVAIMRGRVLETAACVPKLAFTLDGVRIPTTGVHSHLARLRGVALASVAHVCCEGVAKTEGSAPPTIDIAAFVDKETLPAGSPAATVTSDDGDGDDGGGGACSAARGSAATQASVRMGFVNGQSCNAGAHMRTVEARLADAIGDLVTKRLPTAHRSAKVPRSMLLADVDIIVSARVLNPVFHSQAKTELATRATDLGVDVRLPDTFVKRVASTSGLVDRVVDRVSARIDADARRTLGSQANAARKARAPSIPKYEPAARRGMNATLILTEGDSAKALAAAGLQGDRSNVGLFPLRGVLLNPRDIPLTKALAAQTVRDLFAIIGIDPRADYSQAAARRSLAYGRLTLMVDQDADGSHIAGLVINLLHTIVPSLLSALPNFVERLVTPLVKVRPKRGGAGAAAPIEFFSLPQFEAWRNTVDMREYTVEYFKGLGTSTSDDARNYFSRRAELTTTLTFSGRPCEIALNAFFAQKHAQTRRNILSGVPLALDPDDASHVLQYNQGDAIDYGVVRAITVAEFLGRDMAHFAMYDVQRSIPRVGDGLKVSQRKILFALRAKRLVGPRAIKVAQAGAITAAATDYHHGEQALCEAIVGMAQSHAGTNQLPLLCAGGQFGTRNASASVHAAPRYLYTGTHAVVDVLFPRADDPVLDTEVSDDGDPVEPREYVPIIPLVLVNGALGIGTGWSTNVPSFNARDVYELSRTIANALADGGGGGGDDFERVLTAATCDAALAPYFHACDCEVVPVIVNTAQKRKRPRDEDEGAGGDEGDASREGSDEGDADPDKAGGDGVERVGGAALRYRVRGAYALDVDACTVNITELPPGAWVDPTVESYRTALTRDSAKATARACFVTPPQNHSTDVRVDVRGELDEDSARLFEADPGKAYRTLMLERTISLSNMWLFDAHAPGTTETVLRRFDGPADIARAHARARITLYARRRAYMLRLHAVDALRAQEQARFVREVTAGTLRVIGVSAADQRVALREQGFPPLPATTATTRAVTVGDHALVRARINDLCENVTRGAIVAIDGASARVALFATPEHLDAAGEVCVHVRDLVLCTFDYALDLKAADMCSERADALEARARTLTSDYDAMRKQSPATMWRAELDVLGPHLAGM